ncbi:MAG: selenide, water dikinase SelD [Thermodesulfovibrionales bacterium]|nr:selenide, water dikinase SelD [Thermodesulfovibrionales bacterium]
MGPGDLEDLIGSLKIPFSKSVIVGLGDDAAVYDINGIKLVETVDLITPVVNDPYKYGAISACNSISDIYAMGGRPITALAIAGFSSCDYGKEILIEILRGAIDTLTQCDATLVGGHCIDDKELKFGLSVTGILMSDKILTLSSAKKNDILIITKPIGLGVITTSLKGGKLSDDEIAYAEKWMLTLNKEASERAIKSNATACTDVTGFGLLGHGYNMVKNSNLDLYIFMRQVPVLERVYELIDSGMSPIGAHSNLKYLQDKIVFSSMISEEDRLVLADPQTSGGLLIALSKENLKSFDGIYYKVIGEFKEGTGKIYVTD